MSEIREFDGVSIELRLMTESDADAMLAFARSLAEEDLLFLPTDITQPEHLASWLEGIERRATTTTLAIHEGLIGGFSSVERNLTGWARHVAELRVIVAEHLRGKGLGRALADEALSIATDAGIEKVVAHMTLEQLAAIRTFRRLGFENEAVLTDRVKDREGRLHDLLVLRYDISP